MTDDEKIRRAELLEVTRSLRAAIEFEGGNWAHGVVPRSVEDLPAGGRTLRTIEVAPAAPPREKPSKKAAAPAAAELSLFAEDPPPAAPAPGRKAGHARDVPPQPQWPGPKLTREDAEKALNELQDEIGPDCTRCPLAKLGRRKVVFGVGRPDADLVFIGEGPGADEDEQGEPFVGKAGQLLTKMIGAMGYERRDVYICNVVKCRPPGNRDPEPKEEQICGPFMLRQLQIIRPRIIVVLGKVAAMYMKGIFDVPKAKFSISACRGRFERYHGADMMLTYHPSYLLRAPANKKDAWSDLQQVMARLGPGAG